MFFSHKGARMLGDFVMLSVMGPHAGESNNQIFKRKIDDVAKVGNTFWLVRSSRSRPNIVQPFVTEALKHSAAVYCVFISPASVGGAEETSSATKATRFSGHAERPDARDQSAWSALPAGLGPVTGHLDGAAHALILDELQLVHGQELSLWDWAEFGPAGLPIRTRQGSSTLCAVRKNTSSHPDRMKSGTRSIVAIGRLAKPYSVWLDANKVHIAP
jgi:hypothetical protein